MIKVKGIADIVFLMDATSDMMNCIQGVKENLAPFLEAPTEDIGIDHIANRDWRAKVVGFRDFEADGADDWFVEIALRATSRNWSGSLMSLRQGAGAIGQSRFWMPYTRLQLRPNRHLEQQIPECGVIVRMRQGL